MRKIVLFLVVLVLGCGKDDPKFPEAAILVFPAQNSECTTGVDVSPTTSRVDFRWQMAANTNTYQVEVTNLISNITQTSSTSGTTVGITLQRGEPYSWKVISRNNQSQEQAISQTWLFYNAGSETTYAPFPAQVLEPLSGATVKPDANGEILLRWAGADVDADIDSFEVFLDTVNPPVTSIGTLNSNEEALIFSPAPATVYYWRIITTDREGNQSDSGIFSFRTL